MTRTDDSVHHSAEQLVADLFSKGQQLEITADEVSKMGATDDAWMTRERFEDFESVLIQERNQRRHQNTRRHFQHFIQRHLVQNWIATKTRLRKTSECDLIATVISAYVREERERDLAEYLKDVPTLGFKRAEKNRKRRDRAPIYLYAISGIVGVSRLVIMFLIFGAASSKFEMIVFALLALTLNSVGHFSRNESYRFGVSTYALGIQIGKILRKAGADETEREREDRLAQENEARKTVVRSHSLLLLDATFSGIAWLYAFVMLILAIL